VVQGRAVIERRLDRVVHWEAGMTNGLVVAVLVPLAIFIAFAVLVWYDESVHRPARVSHQ
jgi:hypothetical protein